MLSFETKAILRKCNFFHRHLSRPFGPVQLLALLVLDPASTTLKSFLVLWRLFPFHFTFLHQNVYAWVASSLLTTSLSIVNKEFNFIRIGILGITIWKCDVVRSTKSQGRRPLTLEKKLNYSKEASVKSNYTRTASVRMKAKGFPSLPPPKKGPNWILNI